MYLTTFFISILGAASAGLIGNYAAPTLSNPLISGISTGSFQPSGQPSGVSSCGGGLMLGADGNCLQPDITRALFLVEAPRLKLEQRSRQEDLPKPKLHYNIVLVRTPEDPEDENPIVVPPPQHKTVVYVLNKDKVKEDAQVIHTQAPAHKPEIFFVNYKEGENPQLPIGVDLQTALGQVQTLEGQVVDAGQSGTVSGLINNFGNGGSGFVGAGQSGINSGSNNFGNGVSGFVDAGQSGTVSGSINNFGNGGSGFVDAGQSGIVSGSINNFVNGGSGFVDQGVQSFANSGIGQIDLVGAGVSSSLGAANLFGNERLNFGGNDQINFGVGSNNAQFSAPTRQSPSALYGAPN